MPDIFDRVLPLNLIANTVIFYVAARLYLLPLVSRLRPQQRSKIGTRIFIQRDISALSRCMFALCPAGLFALV